MNTFSGTIGASAIVILAALAAPAQAVVSIGLQQVGVNGGVTTTVASGPTFASFSGSYGTFELNLVTGADGVAPALLGSTSLNINFTGSGGQLDVYVTRDSIAGPVPSAFESAFTANTLPLGWVVTEYTYVSDVNALYAGSLLSSKSFLAIGTDEQTSLYAGGGAGPYSVTTRYSLNAPSTGSALSTINVSVVPEPQGYALALASLAVIGFVGRRRRS
jgi:hypothetical protein